MHHSSKNVSWPGIEQLIEPSKIEGIAHHIESELNAFVVAEALDESFLINLKSIFIPLAAWIARKHKAEPIIIGMNGAQGSGKSTLCKLLNIILTRYFKKSTLQVSIDDFYLSRRSRRHLADAVHPLLAVRGVPGTHDVDLGRSILSMLKRAEPSLPLQVPIFDKAQDDLCPKSAWRIVDAPVDIVLFEGWCVGARAQAPHELVDPINNLESSEDQTGAWRSYVNDQLNGPYKELFNAIDYLIMIKVPDMASVLSWRKLQEEKLREKTDPTLSSNKVMSSTQVERFIMYYERLTKHCLSDIPSRADIVLTLDELHQIIDIQISD